MSRIVIVGGLPESLVNFRGELLDALVSRGHDVTAMSAAAPSAVLARLAGMGVAFRPFPIRRNALDPIGDLRTWRALHAAFRELSPDVVLAYTIKPVVWSGLALRRLPGPRFYALVTGLGFAFQQGGPKRALLTALVTRMYAASLARASAVIFQNPDNRQAFLDRGIVASAKCAIVNGSGVDLRRFAVAPMPAGPPVFLSIGRLLGDKGFREYADAARRVRETRPDVRFRLLGMPDPSPDGIPDEELRAWCAAGWIELLPETDDVRPAIAAAHVFVLPSYHEGMPRSVLEAMAMGRPILTTDVAGCRETVVPGENGYLVPKADAPALADRLRWFLDHADAWTRMGARSRQLAAGRFDVDVVNRELMTIMELGR